MYTQGQDIIPYLSPPPNLHNQKWPPVTATMLDSRRSFYQSSWISSEFL